MRILFAFVGGNGHFQPIVPIARAASAAGHTIAVASGPAMASTVEAAGFSVFAIGARNDDDNDKPERIPLRPVNMEREEYDLRENFARRAARSRSAGMLALCAEWRPDLIVCDEIDFGSMIAAERLEIPYASVIVIAAGSFVRPEVVAQPLDEIRAEHGLSPDPTLSALSRYLVLSPVPPGYRDPAFSLPPTAQLIRPLTLESQSAVAPIPFVKPLADTPLVYFTLGTVFNIESGDLFSRVLSGLRDLPINLIVTVGRDIDPAEFGNQPGNIHIAQYIPQATILPHCDLVVSHGGSGSVIAALAYGKPMVLIPMGADQPLNAARCEAIGVAQTLDAITAAPQMIAEAVVAVLKNPSYRQSAERIKDEIVAMPDPSRAVNLLVRLALEKRPLVAK